MSAEPAQQRYLQRHIEPQLPDCPRPATPWRHVLVIPAYRESTGLLQRLQKLRAGSGRSLVIVVLNRPDSDPDPTANTVLRRASAALTVLDLPKNRAAVHSLNEDADLYVHDLEQQCGPTPAKAGVGLARKVGCDIAFKWISQGVIDSQWICCSDADAELPTDYFSRLAQTGTGAVAAVYPFYHIPGEDPTCNRATALYELRLHHYVLGLEYAGSPYAFHTLGSCLAVKAPQYAQVRGFPQRAGGEDFYLLNKLAKLGPVARLEGECIRLASRYSSRAPFGTGPAVAQISDALQAEPGTATTPAGPPLFYHPACFEALRQLLAAVPKLRCTGAAAPITEDGEQLATLLSRVLAAQGMAGPLLPAAVTAAVDLGLADALHHCQRQGKSAGQFLRQFHQWFDAFRTLKFIHRMRDLGWPSQTLQQLPEIRPQLWPGRGNSGLSVEQLRHAALRHWRWYCQPINMNGNHACRGQ